MMAHFRLPPPPPLAERVRPVMGDLQHFCLRWNNYQNNITSAFENLRDDEDFIDVTLACDGKSLKAHRVVLSACSPYFRELLKSTPCKHPVIVLQDVSFDDLQALVQFIYHGEVNVHQKNLTSFLKTAEVLKVSGLTQQPSSTDMFNDNLSHVSSRSSNMSDKRPSSDLHSNQTTEDSPVSRNVAPYKNRRQIRSPTPISRSSYSADDSPLSLKRTKSTEESSPPLLNCSNVTSPIAERSSSSPITVLSSQNQQQSKRGGSSSQRSSPLTNNYDENHNDEERPPVVVDPNKPEEEEDDERDEDEEEEPPMDFSRHSYTKYSQSIMSALQQSQQQQGQPSPKDLSMNVTNAGVKEEPMDLVSCNNNDEDDRESSNSDDRLSDESSVNRPSSGVGEREDPFPAHPGYLDSKLFAAAGASFNFSMAAALAADSFSAGFGHQNHASAASAMLEGFGSSSQDWMELERKGQAILQQHQQQLQQHQQSQQQHQQQYGGQHGCFICGKMLSTRLTLKRHIEQQHHQPLHSAVCTICHKVFRTLNSLNNHKSIYHRKPKWNNSAASSSVTSF